MTLNLLPWRQEKSKKVKKRIIFFVVIHFSVLMVFSVLARSFFKSRTLYFVQEERMLQSKVNFLLEQEKKIQSKIKDASFYNRLNDDKHKTVILLDIMNKLSSVLPEYIYLTAITLDDGQLFLDGVVKGLSQECIGNFISDFRGQTKRDNKLIYLKPEDANKLSFRIRLAL